MKRAAFKESSCFTIILQRLFFDTLPFCTHFCLGSEFEALFLAQITVSGLTLKPPSPMAHNAVPTRPIASLLRSFWNAAAYDQLLYNSDALALQTEASNSCSAATADALQRYRCPELPEAPRKGTCTAGAGKGPNVTSKPWFSLMFEQP